MNNVAIFTSSILIQPIIIYVNSIPQFPVSSLLNLPAAIIEFSLALALTFSLTPIVSRHSLLLFRCNCQILQSLCFFFPFTSVQWLLFHAPRFFWISFIIHWPAPLARIPSQSSLMVCSCAPVGAPTKPLPCLLISSPLSLSPSDSLHPLSSGESSTDLGLVASHWCLLQSAEVTLVPHIAHTGISVCVCVRLK